MPIPALGIVYMHGPDRVNTPRMSDTEMLVAEPVYAPVTAKIIGVYNATGLDAPEQDCGHVLLFAFLSAR